MSWVAVIWSMTAAVCLTLGVMHGWIGWSQPGRRASGLFALTAVEAAAFALFELALMRSASPAASAALVRWGHVPIWAFCLTTLLFVRVYLGGGRPWLAWAVVALRTAALALDFGTGANLNYRRITALRHVRLFGEPVAVAVGTPNPWMLLGQAGLVLMVAFVVDAAVTAWRRGHRRRAAVVGGSIVFFWAAGSCQAALVFWGVVDAPLTFSLFYLGTVVAMGYDVTADAITAATLAHDLRASEHRLAVTAEAAHLGTWVRDLVGGQTWACDRWRVLFDFAPAEPVDLDAFLRRVHPDDRGAVRDTLAAAAAAGDGRYSSEYRVVRRDGPTRWVACQGTFEFDADRAPVRMLGVALDVTDRKRADLEVRDHRENAAHLLRMATLGELSSALAHELNQPLAAILSNAQAAQRLFARAGHDAADDQDTFGDILRDIVADDRRATAVIARLRGMLKKGELLARSVDVDGLVGDVLGLMRGDLRAAGVSVVTELAPGLPPVRGDPVQLQQVLINLITNAAEAMAATPAGGRTLTVRSARADAALVRLCVGDTGPGVAAGQSDQLFQPYHTSKPDGLGLGLSLSRSIVLAHQGRLWVEPRAAGDDGSPTAGATFCFTLPVTVPPPDDPP